MTPEQRKAEIQKMKETASDPKTPPDQVAQLNQAIAELESKGITIPEGLTTPEVEVVKNRLQDIVATSQAQAAVAESSKTVKKTPKTAAKNAPK